MYLEIDIILKLITEQQASTEQMECTCIWPHPWEHYPFQVNGRRKWVRYQALTVEQKQLISNTLNEIACPHYINSPNVIDNA
jgi:hypothetical protein